MRVRYLDSQDVETLTEAMLRVATGAREMDIATAFLTTAGAKQIRALVKRLSGSTSTQRTRVLVGTWMSVTEPTALRLLLRMKGLQLRIAKAPGFHVKHVSFRRDETFVSFTGSANFTAKGLGGHGELMAEVTDTQRSAIAAGERDAFRRLWERAYPDELTEEIIEDYAAHWKPPLHLHSAGRHPGATLLKKFGKQAAKTSTPQDDGSMLWLPVTGSMSNATEAAVRAEAGDQKGDVLEVGSKTTFTRIRAGMRAAWVLDIRGAVKDRRLTYHRILREVELPTDDGRYFAIISKIERSVSLTKNNRIALKELGLVQRADSLRSAMKTLRAGKNTKAAKLLALSKRVRPKSK